MILQVYSCSAQHKIVKNLEKKADDQEQYSHRNCLNELTGTRTADIEKQFQTSKIHKPNIEMSQIPIDRSHRLGKWKSPGQKP